MYPIKRITERLSTYGFSSMSEASDSCWPQLANVNSSLIPAALCKASTIASTSSLARSAFRLVQTFPNSSCKPSGSDPISQNRRGLTNHRRTVGVRPNFKLVRPRTVGVRRGPSRTVKVRPGPSGSQDRRVHTFNFKLVRPRTIGVSGGRPPPRKTASGCWLRFAGRDWFARRVALKGFRVRVPSSLLELT